jgi:murein DD-endopeptidase MepM/ murein hydrolase activator NlpD
MFSRFVIIASLLVMAVLVFCPPEAYGEDRFHTVQRGETFYSIAGSLGIKAEDLMKYNGITDPARLQAGQRLRIPGGGYTSYRVVSGDTLYGIARKFAVTVASIQELNGLSPNYLLREGVSLKIPSGTGQQQGVVIPPVVSQAVQGARETAALTVNSSVKWPVAARELSYMTGKLSGVVITGERTESVSCLTRGTVVSAGPYRGFGKVVIIQADGGYLYVYGGCESLLVKEGDRVGPGAELGKLGVDAVSGKPQLFFMVYRSNSPVDPAKAPRA